MRCAALTRQWAASLRHTDARACRDVGPLLTSASPCCLQVETEMILEKERMGEPPRFAALVQVRGSIPLWWRHRNIFVPKPDVESA